MIMCLMTWGVFSAVRADQGRFLDYIVSWGNLTEEKVALYLRDILEALQYLHGWKVAHLDLKVSRQSLLYLHISQVSFFFPFFFFYIPIN